MTQARVELLADSRQVRRATDDLKALESRGQATTNVVGGLARAFVALGAAAVLGKTISQVRQFETALLGVAKTTGLSGAQLEQFASNISDLSLRIPVSTNELLELAQAAGQMGVSGAENLEKFSLTVAKLGRASDLAGAEAATALARILNVTGENIGSIDTLASVIVSLGNNVAATESEIARMTTEVARATSVFGVSSSEAAGLAAAMTSIGIRAELGGSSVGRAMQEITSAVQAGGSTLNNFASTLGLNGDRLAQAFQEDKLEAFRLFLGAVGELGLDAGNALEAVGLGGQEIAKTIIPLSGNLEILTRTLGLANEETKNATALDREFEATLNSLDSQVIISQNALAELGRELGGELTPALTASLKAVNQWAAEGDNLADAADAIVTAVTAVAAVFAARLVGSIGSATLAYGQHLVAQQAVIARYAQMNAVSITAARSMVAMGVAARGAGAAMAFLGGPIGVAVLAAGALVYFSDSAETAAEKAAPLREEVDALRQSMQELSETELREEFNSLSREAFKVLPADIRRVKSELDSLNESILERQQSIAAPGGANTLSPALLKDIERAQDLEQRLESLTLEQAAAEEKAIALGDELVRLGESGKAAAEGVDEASGAASEGSKSFDSMVASLTEQIIELRDGADAAEDFAIAQRLGADASEDEKKKIDDLVATLRELREERDSEQLRGQVTTLVNTLSVGDDPAAQAEDRYFERLSIIDNSIAAEGQILDEHRTAMLLAEQAYQDELTRLTEEGARARAEAEERASQMQLQQWNNTLGATAQVFGNLADIAKEGGKDSFESYKALASAQAGVSGVMAFMNALATPAPFPIPQILAGTIAAVTAAQIAKLQSQQYNPRALGGQVQAGGQYLVGERGPELITMGSNGNVTPYNQLMREARTTNNSNNMTANISFTLPEGNADFRNRIADNRDLIYNVVADVLNDRGQRF